MIDRALNDRINDMLFDLLEHDGVISDERCMEIASVMDHLRSQVIRLNDDLSGAASYIERWKERTS